MLRALNSLCFALFFTFDFPASVLLHGDTLPGAAWKRDFNAYFFFSLLPSSFVQAIDAYRFLYFGYFFPTIIL
jgi:hypothetical protein